VNTTIIGVLAGLAVLLFTVELLRRNALREKYAVLWLLVALTGVVFTVFPNLLAGLAHRLGFQVPANLVFALAAMVLLVVGMQLSLEVGRLEDRSQRLAEEVALLRLDIDKLESERRTAGPAGADTGAGDAVPGDAADGSAAS
jgi:hypothetical protein